MNQLERDIHVLTQIVQTIFDKKGANILTLDVRSVCSIADYFIIADGAVAIHTKAIADKIIETLKSQGFKLACSEGEDTGDWIVLDFSGIIIHLFVPELREKYQIENVWKEGKIVDIPIILGENSINKRYMTS